MKENIIKVNMLGTFSIALDDIIINDSNNRSKKIWLLLAYLICNRNRAVPSEELANLLWGSSEQQENPSRALNTILWRARSVLEPLSNLLGDSLIVRSKDGCIWNPQIKIEVDLEQFEEIYHRSKKCEDEDLRLDECRKALALYKGSFLTKLNTESWVNMTAMYYNNIYINTLQEVLPMLLERNYPEEIEELCKVALYVDPYNEVLYQYLLQSMVMQGDTARAKDTYEKLQDWMFSQLGISLSDETQQIYKRICQTTNQYALSPTVIKEQLKETTPISGAVCCDFSFFKFFYQAEARSAVRRGDAVHIGIFSVTDKDGNELSRRSLDRAMENLQVQIQRSLRKSDVISRCSDSQFVVLLLQANYENSCKVCDRVINAFRRIYPHSPAAIHYTVMPLEPISTY